MNGRPRPRLVTRRVVDRCPVCHVDMGGPQGGTRRIALSSAQRGLFLWECPDCGGRWEQSPGHQPRPVPGSLRPRPPVD